MWENIHINRWKIAFSPFWLQRDLVWYQVSRDTELANQRILYTLTIIALILFVRTHRDLCYYLQKSHLYRSSNYECILAVAIKRSNTAMIDNFWNSVFQYRHVYVHFRCSTVTFVWVVLLLSCKKWMNVTFWYNLYLIYL